MPGLVQARASAAGKQDARRASSSLGAEGLARLAARIELFHDALNVVARQKQFVPVILI